MSETSDLRKFLKWANGIPNVWAVRVHSGSARGNRQKLAEAGTPDAYLLADGHHVWIEAKAPKGRLSEAQQRVHARIRRCGGVVLVVDDWDAMRDYVRGMLRG